MSCGVNSPNSLATIPGTVNLNANLSHSVFHLHEQTYHLSQSHIPIPKFLQSWKQENSPVPRPGHMPSLDSSAGKAIPTPKTSAWPPPTCPASPRQRPSCSPRRACPGVGLPVGTRGLPRLGGAALQPRGSRWSAKVVKHEKSSRSRGFMADLWERVKVNEGHNSWTSGMKMLFQALVKHSLNSERGATKNYDTCLHLR